MGAPIFEINPEDTSIQSTTTTIGDFRSQLTFADRLIDGLIPEEVTLDAATAFLNVGSTAAVLTGTISTGTNNSGQPTVTVSSPTLVTNAHVGQVLVRGTNHFYIESNSANQITLAGVNRLNTGTGSFSIFRGAAFTVPLGAFGLTGNGPSDVNAVPCYISDNGATLPAGSLTNGRHVWAQYITPTIYGLTLSNNQFNDRNGPGEKYETITAPGSGNIKIVHSGLVHYASDGGAVLAEDTGRGWKGQGYQFSSPVDLTGKQLAVPMEATSGTLSQVIAVLIDTDGDWKSFVVNNGVDIAIKQYAVIDVENSTGMVHQQGTFDHTSLDRAILYIFNASWTANAALNQPTYLLLNRTPDIVGSSSGDPTTVADLYNLCQTAYPGVMFDVRQPGIQYQARFGFRFGGSGVVESHFFDSLKSMVFAPQSDGITTYRDYTPALGISINGSAASSFRFSNSQLGRGQAFDLSIEPTNAGTVNLDSTGEVNATFVSRSGNAFTGKVFVGGNGITHNDATYTRCTFQNINRPAGYIILTPTHNLVSPTFRTDTPAHHAIEIPAAGDYDTSGFDYAGFTAPINVSAASGVVNITYTDTPPAFFTAGATVNLLELGTISGPNILDGSMVKVTNVTKSVVLDRSTVAGGSGYSLTVNFLSASVDVGDSIRIQIAKYDTATGQVYQNLTVNGTLSQNGFTFGDIQSICPVCTAIHAKGAAFQGQNITDFVFDGAAIEIDFTVSIVSGQKLATWKQYQITQDEAFFDVYFGTITPINIENFISSTALEVNNEGVSAIWRDAAWVRADGQTIVAADSASIQFDNGLLSVASAGGSKDTIIDAIAALTARLEAMIENASGDRFTAKALENAIANTNTRASEIRDNQVVHDQSLKDYALAPRPLTTPLPNQPD